MKSLTILCRILIYLAFFNHTGSCFCINTATIVLCDILVDFAIRKVYLFGTRSKDTTALVCKAIRDLGP